jgi:hypothetical protein
MQYASKLATCKQASNLARGDNASQRYAPNSIKQDLQ